MWRQLTVLSLLLIGLVVWPVRMDARQSSRALNAAMSRIYALDRYTVFDWITGSYEKGTLTLEGFVARPDLKARVDRVAKEGAGIDTVVNRLEVLPALPSDDAVRVRTYVAIYGSSALSRYAPGGGGFDSLGELRELETAGTFGLDASTQFRGPHPIHIIVSGNRVQLFGEVGSAQDRQLAEVQARSLSGVLSVTNRLTVRSR